jgi:ABC-type sugar transport system ATPase subunit
VELLGYESVIHARVGTIRLTARAEPTLVPAIGSPLTLRIESEHVHLFDRATGKAIEPPPAQGS